MKDSIKCPLCDAQANYKQLGTEKTGFSHMWSCENCPFVGFEFTSDVDAYFVYRELTEKE
jgi:hypothetical protein